MKRNLKTLLFSLVPVRTSALEELEDALGREQRTAQVRAEIDRRRRRQETSGDLMMAEHLVAPMDPYAVGFWPSEAEFANMTRTEQQMFEQQLVQQERLNQRRTLMSALRGTQSLAEDRFANHNRSPAFVLPNGHHTNEFLLRNSAPILHKTLQSQSFDGPYDPYAFAPSELMPMDPYAESAQYPYPPASKSTLLNTD
jgi:hypothetical protein